MHILFKRQIFRRRQCHFRRDKTFHNRIVRQIQKHGYVIRNPALLERIAEEIRHIMLYTHCRKYDRELFI